MTKVSCPITINNILFYLKITLKTNEDLFLLIKELGSYDNVPVLRDAFLETIGFTVSENKIQCLDEKQSKI